MPIRLCDECHGTGCEVCNSLGWERTSRTVSAMIIEVKKYGQITKVFVEGKEVKSSAMTVKATLSFLKEVLAALHIENVEFREGE